jgi:hypothetical protein
MWLTLQRSNDIEEVEGIVVENAIAIKRGDITTLMRGYKEGLDWHRDKMQACRVMLDNIAKRRAKLKSDMVELQNAEAAMLALEQSLDNLEPIN